MSFELLRPFLRPIEPLLLDDEVSEIMGNPNATWYIERGGKMLPQPDVSFEPGSLRTGLEVIANNLGKRLDEDNPVLEARLPDGSRICAYIPPAVKPFPGLTIRKFTGRHFTIEDLIARGTVTRSLAEFLAAEILGGKTILISGGTGMAKTSLLNVLAQAIPDDERVVTIEDTAELLIRKPNIVSFECQTDTFKQSIDFEKLLRTALRCRPDRIIVGEVRGPEARTLLDSLNTGHSGSLATIHANSAEQALRRFANLVLRSHQQTTYADVEAEIGEAVDYVVHIERQAGRRMVREVLRVPDYDRLTRQFQTEYAYRAEAPISGCVGLANDALISEVLAGSKAITCGRDSPDQPAPDPTIEVPPNPTPKETEYAAARDHPNHPRQRYDPAGGIDRDAGRSVCRILARSSRRSCGQSPCLCVRQGPRLPGVPADSGSHPCSAEPSSPPSGSEWLCCGGKQ